MTESLQLDALEAQNNLRERLIELATSYRPFRDPHLLSLCQKAWAGDEQMGGIVGQLWVECLFPSKNDGQTLELLTGSGGFNRALMEVLDRPGANPKDRVLYRHQADSIRLARQGVPEAAAGERPAIVVSAGTGAGKTESFLLPVLDDLFTHPRQPGETGIRALLLYPMNALVNDQVARLEEWLREQPDRVDQVTFLHFTSETPEDLDALRKSSAINEVPPPCRLRTRVAGRAAPPDILITNYSMLEYMLCRPQDAPFFGPGLRALVLDEAHMYSGTLAADICMLLRRVLLRAGVRSDEMLQIATSATLGGTPKELQAFIAALFSKRRELVRTIYGDAHQRQLAVAQDGPAITAAEITAQPIAQRTLLHSTQRIVTDDPTAIPDVRACLRPLVAPAVLDQYAEETAPARLLWHALRHAPLVHRMDAFFWDHRQAGQTIVPLRLLASD